MPIRLLYRKKFTFARVFLYFFHAECRNIFIFFVQFAHFFNKKIKSDPQKVAFLINIDLYAKKRYTFLKKIYKKG